MLLHGPGDLYRAYDLLLESLHEFAGERGLRKFVPAPSAPQFEFSAAGSLAVGSSDKPELILPASNTFQKQIAATFLGSAYCVAASYRREAGEPSSTPDNHSSVFHQIEVEVVDLDAKAARALALDLLSYLEARVGRTDTVRRFAEVPREIDLLEEQPQLEYADYDSWADDLCASLDAPVWIVHTPQTPPPCINSTVAEQFSSGFDLLLPPPVCELLSGGVRDLDETRAFFGTADPLDLAPSAGFGIGLERLMMALLGASSISDVRPPHWVA